MATASKKRKSEDSQELTDPTPSKKQKTDNQQNKLKNQACSNLNTFMKQWINHSSSDFANNLKSNELSSIIYEYIKLDVNNSDYSFLYLSSTNEWKHKNKLKKSEKIEYLNEQIIHPIQYLIEQFDIKQINNSLHHNYFINGKSTSKTKWSINSNFWVSSGVFNPKKPKYWKSNDSNFISNTMNSVCHFIQKESGTGVHIGDGMILSCAHVIASDIDDEENEAKIDRINRNKYVIFANGIIYKAKCIKFDNDKDLALLRIDFDSKLRLECVDIDKDEIGTAVLSDNMPKLKSDLFCIGNPSNINLECDTEEGNDFDPKIFHLSFGKLEMEHNDNDELGGYGHSCWTYWGHSGAPIFNENGEVVSLHNSWNDETGLRHGVKLNVIIDFVKH